MSDRFEFLAIPDTMEFINALGYENLSNSLKFNKFLRLGKGKGIKFDYNKTLKGTKKFDIPQEIRLRISKLFKDLSNSSPYMLSTDWELRTGWRMVIGLGTPHVHETGMVWHHIWGIPYIPGSALKGVARTYYLYQIWEKLVKIYPELNPEKDLLLLERWLNEETIKGADQKLLNLMKNELNSEKQVFQIIFGTLQNKGTVVFMDAYPMDKYQLDLDIINVHYPEYYSCQKDYAADWESPNPVFFLTLTRTKFKGLLLLDKKRLNYLASELSPRGILDKAKKVLIKALKTHGIGAKTSLGYGILK